MTLDSFPLAISRGYLDFWSALGTAISYCVNHKIYYSHRGIKPYNYSQATISKDLMIHLYTLVSLRFLINIKNIVDNLKLQLLFEKLVA